MADDVKDKVPDEAPSDDFSLDEAGGDFALRAEMGAQEFVLKNGLYLAAAAGAIFVGFVVYGWWSDAAVSAQRAATSRISDVERALPSDLLQLAQAKAGFGDLPESDTLKTQADALVAVGDESSGTASVEAWLKAAELYRIADDDDARRAALDKAAGSADGVLAYAAKAALANLDLEQGKTDEGLKRLEQLAAIDSEFLARQATLDLAAAQDAVGRSEAARATYDRFLSTWPTAPEAEEAAQRRDRIGQAPAVAAPAPQPAQQDPEPDDAGAEGEGEPSPGEEGTE